MTPWPEPARLLRNWRDELDSAALYDALAHIERDRYRRAVYEALAGAERRHAAFWEERLRAAGQWIPSFRPALRTRILIHLARRLGIGFVVPSVIAREMKDGDATHNRTMHGQPVSLTMSRDMRRPCAARAMADLATTCARRYSAPTTGWLPTSV